MFSASVVITTKNRKEELLKAVKSALSQRGLLEVIVIDDGSTDGTADGTADELKKIFNHNRALARVRERATEGWPEGRASGDERVKGHGEHGGLVCSEAGPCLDKPSGAAFSNPSPSELTQDSENTSLIRSADGPASLPATSYSPPVTTSLPVLRLIRHEESRGLIVRRNEGARVARGDVIFSMDDDAVFSSPFVVEQTLRDFSHPRIGAVAIPYIEPHKANKEMQRAPTREDVWIAASYIGTAHAVRRDVFLALGGYREHLVHQGEEGDFCLRMLAAEKPIADGGGLKANSAEGVKALDSGPSTLDAAPLSAVPGFFVRLGNSDPIIHNESPKRDFSRMDFYGRRNDVLFHWQNTPMPDLLWQLPSTIAGGLHCAYRVKRWEKMACGIFSGIFEMLKGAKREPVGKKHFRFYKQLKTCGPTLMEK